MIPKPVEERGLIGIGESTPKPATRMEPQTLQPSGPVKYFRFDRRLIGALDGIKRVVEGVAAATAFSPEPWLAGVLIAVRIGLSFTVNAAEATNPMKSPDKPNAISVE